MTPIAFAKLLGAAACLTVSCAPPSMRSTRSAPIEVQTDDVTRFYNVYEAADGHPTAEQIQHDYLDPGTEGLRHLT